jgi:uncharacterized membrane protein (UPF0127 family)
MRVANVTKNRLLVENGKGQIARTRWERLWGLLGRAVLAPGTGLWLPGTKAVHTFGMRFAIDVVFVDRHNKITHLIPRMPPFRVSPYVRYAVGALELPPETLQATDTQLDDTLEFNFASARGGRK